MFLRQETDVVRHREPHRIHRAGWLRAAVLGANDGIVSSVSLVWAWRRQGQVHRAL